MAFNVMFHQCNIPVIETSIDETVKHNNNDDFKSKPVNKKVTEKMAKSDRPSDTRASSTMFKYCS